MSTRLALALAGLALLGSGCDAVFGEVRRGNIDVAFHAVSGDDGENAGGTVITVGAGGAPTTFDVGCLKVRGNLAIVGADVRGESPVGGGFVEFYVDDRPEAADDRITGTVLSTRGRSDCAEEPRVLPDGDRAGSGAVHVIDDFSP